MLAANLLFAAGDRQGIARLTGTPEEADQGADLAEVGSILVDPAAAAAGVEVNAPAIAADHGQIGDPLLGAEGFQSISPEGRIEAAAGAAARDAAPNLLGAGAIVGGAPKAATAGSAAPGHGHPPMTSHHSGIPAPWQPIRFGLASSGNSCWRSPSMGIDFHLISNFAALALITLAGPAVIFILFYRRGAL